MGVISPSTITVHLTAQELGRISRQDGDARNDGYFWMQAGFMHASTPCSISSVAGSTIPLTSPTVCISRPCSVRRRALRADQGQGFGQVGTHLPSYPASVSPRWPKAPSAPPERPVCIDAAPLTRKNVR